MLNNTQLFQILHYEPQTGLVSWLKSRGFKRAGGKAGGMQRGSIVVTIDGIRYKAQDIAWRSVHGVQKHSKIWHINGNAEDNRICNLTNKKPKTYSKAATVVKTSTGYGVNGVNCDTLQDVYDQINEVMT